MAPGPWNNNQHGNTVKEDSEKPKRSLCLGSAQ